MSEQQTEAPIPQWDLADRLRKALREADVSVQEMAEYLEISRNTAGSWINGRSRRRSRRCKGGCTVETRRPPPPVRATGVLIAY